MEDNPSVEELLKSLRQTMEKRANAHKNQEDILVLKNPIESVSKNSKEDDKVIDFLNQVIEKVVLRVLMENKSLLQNAIENVLTNVEAKNLFTAACRSYVESRRDFEHILKEVIEKKIASLLK